ncbi:MAG TPA: M15 family metallopeptidase [Acidimicrobiales bacterium]|nr:M15 family metallopeptidase [Acidimicrobiales bacterium]
MTVSHWSFEGSVRQGELVVHADVADDIVQVFRALFDARFPIERMELVDVYGGDDTRSMDANNTSAFNCRPATGSSRWSEHAYGRAIDINPVQNPYVPHRGPVQPSAGSAFVDRSPSVGVITADGPVVGAFAAIGWEWGGSWSSAKDYQHFSESGR